MRHRPPSRPVQRLAGPVVSFFDFRAGFNAFFHFQVELVSRAFFFFLNVYDADDPRWAKVGRFEGCDAMWSVYVCVCVCGAAHAR